MRFGSYLFSGIFALAGLAAFLGSSYSPIEYWLKHGYWQEPPTQILFGCIFLASHGGIGFAGLLFLWNNPPGKEDLPNSDPTQPWLSKTYWANPTIASSMKSYAPIVRGMAIYAAMISLIAIIAIVECIKLKQYQALFGLVFPFVAFLLYRWSRKLHYRLNKYGVMPLTLDPHPGSIGGQFGGRVAIKRLQQQVTSSEVELSCIHHYKSGDDSHQSIVWNEKMVPAWRTTIDGHELEFCFDLPNDLPESQVDDKYPYYQWRLDVKVTLADGSAINRDYEKIPVFKTSQASRITHSEAKASQSQATKVMHDKVLDALMPFRQQIDGSYHIHYPAGRHANSWVGILVGLIFIIAGIFIPDIIFNIAFPLIGGLVFLGGMYSLANSLSVDLDPISIHTKRYLFGILIKEKTLATYAIKNIKEKASHGHNSGGKVVQYYKLLAHGANGEKLTLAENLEGMGQVKAAISRVNAMLGRKPAKTQ